jgi:predicted Zn-dependent protease
MKQRRGEMRERNWNLHPRVAGGIRHAFLRDAQGDPSGAAEDLIVLVGEFPCEPALCFCVAHFLVRAGQLSEACEHARQAVRLAPSWEKASLLYFDTQWKLGRREGALEEMRRFLEQRSSEVYSGLLAECLRDWEPGEGPGEGISPQ